MSFIYSFAVKKLFRFENVQFLEFLKLVSMLKNGFHGDMFAAREHNTNGMFHFLTKILFTTNVGP